MDLLQLLCLLLHLALINAGIVHHLPPTSSDLQYVMYYPASRSMLNNFTPQSVKENALLEQQLPIHLLKSHRFFNNPHTAAALAKESWLTNEETRVAHSEAEKIPRNMILKLFKDAGLDKF